MKASILCMLVGLTIGVVSLPAKDQPQQLPKNTMEKIDSVKNVIRQHLAFVPREDVDAMVLWSSNKAYSITLDRKKLLLDKKWKYCGALRFSMTQKQSKEDEELMIICNVLDLELEQLLTSYISLSESF